MSALFGGRELPELPWCLPGGLLTGYGAVGSTPQQRPDPGSGLNSQPQVYKARALPLNQDHDLGQVVHFLLCKYKVGGSNRSWGPLICVVGYYPRRRNQSAVLLATTRVVLAALAWKDRYTLRRAKKRCESMRRRPAL